MQRLTIERTMQVILFALIFIMATRVPVDTDTWWHLRSAEHTLSQGMIYEDPFSHTQNGERWINHSWGAQLLLLAVWELAGDVGLALYTAGLATAGIGFVFLASAGNTYQRGFVMVLAAATAAVFWSARPQMLSFFFSAVVLYLLYDFKRGGRDRLWLIPAVMLLWGNLHAGYSIGFIFGAAFVGGEIMNQLVNRGGDHVVSWAGIRKLIVVGLASLAALVVNPYGPQILLVPFETVSIGPLRQFIQEWNPPDFRGRETWPFIFMVMALFGALWTSRLKFDWTGFLLICGTLFMSLLAGRQIAVFAVAAAPALTFHLDSALRERGWILRPQQRVSPRLARLNAILLGLTAFVVLVVTLSTLEPAFVDEVQAERLPVEAVAWLNEEQPPGPMFNSYNWGGYLMFAAPEYPVFVDGRTDLYGDFLLTYLRAAQGLDGWREILARFDIRLVVVEKGSGLDLSLSEAADWMLRYDDDLAVIYQREAS